MNEFTGKILVKLQGSIKSKFLYFLAIKLFVFESIWTVQATAPITINNSVKINIIPCWKAYNNIRLLTNLHTLSPTFGDSLPSTFSVNSRLVKVLSPIWASIIFNSFKFDSRCGGMVPWNLQLSLFKNTNKSLFIKTINYKLLKYSIHNFLKFIRYFPSCANILRF